MIKRALISVTDKRNLVELAQLLQEKGVEIISTGGTSAAIRASGIPVTDVAAVTGFPEMLDGRLKTIHPKIAGGILGIRGDPVHVQQLAEKGIKWIDIVVVNLYDFAGHAAAGSPRDMLVENIDIGGPTMIRAAAKNWKDVVVLVDPLDYEAVMDEMRQFHNVTQELRWRLARKAFRLTGEYDRLIYQTLDRLDYKGNHIVAA